MEFDATFDIIDHLPNQSSGFSATLLKNKTTHEYTLAFRSTEYRNIEAGGDAQRDSVRGAAGDIAFNGMAFTQLSSMERYWKSLLDGTRAQGATPDKPLTAAGGNFLRPNELLQFRNAVLAGATVNVSGYSLGGHLATMFSVLHGERVNALYLFNSSGVGHIRDSASGVTYRSLLDRYDFYMRPENREAAYEFARAWAGRVASNLGLLAAYTVRATNWLVLFKPFLPRELSVLSAGMTPSEMVSRLISLVTQQDRDGLPKGADQGVIQAGSALSFMLSLALSENLEGSHELTLDRMAGRRFPSLQESGLIPAGVRIYQTSGVPVGGAPSVNDYSNLLGYSDWNIVADSGIRAARDADLISVYIENQPTAAGIPFTDKGWGDFGTTHSITLIVDSLAVMRMLQRADATLTQASVEQIMQAASNLRKAHYGFFKDMALAEHDTMERVVDAVGRLLFGRQFVDAINWRKDLMSSDGIAAYGQLIYRDPLHERIQAIERKLVESSLAGRLVIESLALSGAGTLRAEAGEDTARGAAFRYALLELNPFVVTGSPALYEQLGRDVALKLFDPGASTGRISSQWIDDRAAFLAARMRVDMADHSYLPGDESMLFESANGERVLVFSSLAAAIAPPPQFPITASQRDMLRTQLVAMAGSGLARIERFGAEGDPAQSPSTVAGGADALRGGMLDDRLYGEGGNDFIEGLGGNDYVEGGPGDDRLFGGPGKDTLVGGAGEDRYVWNAGDGFDRIVETREADGLRHGSILVRTSQWELAPRAFRRDETAPAEIWRSADRNFLLAHGATSWTLSFAGGEIDLGADLRSGDFGFEIDGPARASGGTIIDGFPADDVLVGPNRGTPRIVGGYGHDRLYGVVQMSVDDFRAASAGPGLEGWGLWISAGPGDDVALGTSKMDIIEGGGGIDVLAGGAGNDVLFGDHDFEPDNIDPATWTYVESAAMPYDIAIAPSHTATARLNVYPEQYPGGPDRLYGGGGRDYLFGEQGDDLIEGDDGSDVLLGGEGNDVLAGGSGDDRLTGENFGYAPVPFEIVNGFIVSYRGYVEKYGDDVLDGGGGNDELIGEGGADILSGGDGNDALYGDLDTVPGRLHGADILSGGAGDDTLHGQGDADMAFGGEGNDILIGDGGVEPSFHGNDLLYGESGNDQIVGAGGADTLSGGEGADQVIGDALDLALVWHGGDVIDGGAGDDVMYGLGGADEIIGGTGDDWAYGDHPDDAINGDNDRIDGGPGADRLWGEGGSDLLIGGPGADQIFAEHGDDTLDGGPGADLLSGGPGNDTYLFRPGDGVDRIEDNAGITTVAFVEGVDVASLRLQRSQNGGTGAQPLQIEFGDGDRITLDPLIGLDALRIRIGDSDVLGGAELQSLNQSAGTLVAGSDASEILQAAPASSLFGFSGDDLLLGSPLADRLNGGDGDDELRGLEGNDILLGGAGADVLIGGAGDDRLEGGPGSDVYEIGLPDGIDTLVETGGADVDVVRYTSGVAADDLRFRRSGQDLVLAQRRGEARVRVLDWFAPSAGAERLIDRVEFDTGVPEELDADAITARVVSDRRVMGTEGADVLVGDEFDDDFDAGPGDDLVVGGLGDDRYRYDAGDGSDILADGGGFDVLVLGDGIDPGALDFTAERDASGALTVVATMAGDGGQIRFGEARANRIDAFEFAGGETLLIGDLLARGIGLRQTGTPSADTMQGGAYADSLYGFDGNDTLTADAGADLLVGATGDDLLVGGAHDDTYRFNAGDGRDAIVEFFGNDEYRLYRGYYTPDGRRAYDIDGASFVAVGAAPGPGDETFNVGLASVQGGTDTLRLGEGIVPADIRFGLDLGMPALPFAWLVDDGAGGAVPGVQHAEQVGYVLEIGEQGDAVEIVWPFSGGYDHLGGRGLESVPVERVAFGDDAESAWTFADLFARAGGWLYVVGSEGADALAGAAMLPGGWMAGGRGDDRYLDVMGLGIGVMERAGEGIDTVVVPQGFADADLMFDQQDLLVEAPQGRLTLRAFDAAHAEAAMIERFEREDGSVVTGAQLLAGGVTVAGTQGSDVLSGTSVNDRIDAGAGDDVVSSIAGNDTIRGGAGSDRLSGGTGADRYRYSAGDGNDVIAEAGTTGEDDVLVFENGLRPSDIGVHRRGDDLVFDIGDVPNGATITVVDWFADTAKRVESVEFAEDGELWREAELLARSVSQGGTAPTDPVNHPPHGEDTSSPVVDPIALPQGTEASGSGAQGSPGNPSTPIADTSSTPRPAAPVDLSVYASEEGNGAVAGPTRSAPRTLLSGEASSVGTAALSAPASLEVELATGPLSLPPSTLESLAAGGYVSPGRVTVPSDGEARSTVQTDSPQDTQETELQGASPSDGDAMLAYWRSLHARLDAHLERGDMDDAQSAGIHARLPLGLYGGDDGLRMPHSSSIGLGGAAGFDARRFEGLREGVVRLG